MLTNSDAEILEIYQDDLMGGKTMRSIALSMGKPYPHVHRHIHAMLDRGVLTKKEVGPSYLCFLNLASETGRLAMSMTAMGLSQARHKQLALSLKTRLPTRTVAFIEKDSLHLLSDDPREIRKRIKGLDTKHTVIVQTPDQYFSSKGASLPLPTLLVGYYEFFRLLSQIRSQAIEVVSA